MKVQTPCSVWDIASSLHYDNNYHHNYLTNDREDALEIALDFFSSILIKFEVRELPITHKVILFAGSLVRTWSTYKSSSLKIKDAFDFVEYQLFKLHKTITPDDLVLNPRIFKRQAGNFSQRKASEKLISFVEKLFSKRVFKYKEVDILLLLLKDLYTNHENSVVFLNWKSVFNTIVAETAGRRFLNYLTAHRNLIYKFHTMLKKQNNRFYVVKDKTVLEHDKDKLEPFMFITYMLKHEYKEKIYFDEHSDWKNL